MKTPNLVSVIMPTFRRPAMLRVALRHVLEQKTDVPFEVIVVDDGSGDETPDVVAAIAETVELRLRCLQQANRGAGAARNTGAAAADGALLLFTDDDMLIAPDHLERHLKAHRLFGDCLVNPEWTFSPESVARMSATPFGRWRMEIERWYQETSASYEPLGDNRFRPSGLISGNLSVERSLWSMLGGFNEAIPHAGLEDQEFSIRAVAAGCNLVQDRNIQILADEPFATLDTFCERRRTGAYDTVCAARVAPESFADHPMIVENLPPDASDGWRPRAKKLAKRALATRSGERTLRRVIATLERFAPDSRGLKRAYWAISGIYIVRGVDDALREGGPIQTRTVTSSPSGT